MYLSDTNHYFFKELSLNLIYILNQFLNRFLSSVSALLFDVRRKRMWPQNVQ